MTFEEWHKKEFGPTWEESGIARAFKDRRREGWNGGYAEGVREGLAKAIHVSCITCRHGYKPVKNSDGQFMHLNGSALCNANRFHKLIAILDGK
jgi:hypothetical protein